MRRLQGWTTRRHLNIDLASVHAEDLALMLRRFYREPKENRRSEEKNRKKVRFALETYTTKSYIYTQRIVLDAFMDLAYSWVNVALVCYNKEHTR